ncbi:MAG: DotU family type IV/VI secretion system protein, partial [Planctomycetota bacterium]
MSSSKLRLSDFCSKTFLFLTTFQRRAGRTKMDPAWVRQRLLEIFREQEQRAQQSPQIYELYKRASYLLVVTADDIILGADWEGADGWELLETELFQSRIGGTRFFELRKEPVYGGQELLEIFYLCLALGFKGKYYGKGEEELAEIRQEIYLSLEGKSEDLATPITPDAYKENNQKDFTKMPVVNALRLAIVLLGVALFLALGA